MILDRRRVLSNLFDRLYGGTVIRNDLRGELVEEIVGMALAPEWKLCGSDWSSCDLQHAESGLRIQVKQSAARQSWAPGNRGHVQPRFSVAAKTGRYEGANWIAGEGRNAEIFVFAWHGVTGPECDHANPEQWTFYVVAEAELPAQKSVGLVQIERIADPATFHNLRDAVGGLANKLTRLP